MRKLIIVIFSCLSAFFATANDGVFYASGNQLIPITETDISVKKEVLTLNRVGDHLEVTVYYEFFNPVGEKELLVGFEAQSPYNSMADAFKMLPKHPHIRNFKVVMNGEPLTYDIANVKSGRYDKHDNYILSPYYANGRFLHWSPQQIEDTLTAWGDPPGLPIDYVYHFKAQFRPGLNIIQHTYDFDLSFSVGEEFYFPYVLTAANRWANHQIDDFTLRIKVKNTAKQFCLLNDGLWNGAQWRVTSGTGKVHTIKAGWGDGTEYYEFSLRNGTVEWHKTNFRPKSNFAIISPDNVLFYRDDFKLGRFYDRTSAVLAPYEKLTDEDQKKGTTEGIANSRILRNLPYASRGYVFKDAKLAAYFKSLWWYMPDPSWQQSTSDFTSQEREWLK